MAINSILVLDIAGYLWAELVKFLFNTCWQPFHMFHENFSCWVDCIGHVWRTFLCPCKVWGKYTINQSRVGSEGDQDRFYSRIHLSKTSLSNLHVPSIDMEHGRSHLLRPSPPVTRHPKMEVTSSARLHLQGNLVLTKPKVEIQESIFCCYMGRSLRATKISLLELWQDNLMVSVIGLLVM